MEINMDIAKNVELVKRMIEGRIQNKGYNLGILRVVVQPLGSMYPPLSNMYYVAVYLGNEATGYFSDIKIVDGCIEEKESTERLVDESEFKIFESRSGTMKEFEKMFEREYKKKEKLVKMFEKEYKEKVMSK